MRDCTIWTKRSRRNSDINKRRRGKRSDCSPWKSAICIIPPACPCKREISHLTKPSMKMQKDADATCKSSRTKWKKQDKTLINQSFSMKTATSMWSTNLKGNSITWNRSMLMRYLDHSKIMMMIILRPYSDLTMKRCYKHSMI